MGFGNIKCVKLVKIINLSVFRKIHCDNRLSKEIIDNQQIWKFLLLGMN